MKQVQNAMAMLNAFWEKASLYMKIPKMTVTNLVEIIIIAFLFYYMLVWIKNTRAWVLLKGILVISAFCVGCGGVPDDTILWIAQNTLSVAIIALVVIFQPELRKALKISEENFLTSFFSFDFSRGDTGKFSDKTINELVKACYEMGKGKDRRP